MADPPTHQNFPYDGALCECCGYPLKGLTSETVCPECGSSFEHSSPDRRKGPLLQRSFSVGGWLATTFQILLFTEFTYRLMRIDRSNRTARTYLGFMLLVVSCFALLTTWRDWLPIQSNLLFFLLFFLSLSCLTYLEMLGVAAFSKRRDWRVPFHLAERVCCYASVGWLMGVLIAEVGAWLMVGFAIDKSWFDHPLGLVRVGWILYGALFFLSLLWFETLVWIGVRQVRYANAWPESPPNPIEITPETAPEK